jgi:hypothetical protein
LLQNETLRVELRKQRSRYDLLVMTVREQQERLHATNALRKKWETTLYKQCKLPPLVLLYKQCKLPPLVLYHNMLFSCHPASLQDLNA